MTDGGVRARRASGTAPDAVIGSRSSGRPRADAATRRPVPEGFRIALGRDTRRLAGDLWYGGAPPRVLRLSARGRAAWDGMASGPIASRAAGLVARRFTDAGLAHPLPPAAAAGSADVTVVIPVRDRAPLLDGCLASLGGRYPAIVVDDGSRDGAAVAAVAAAHGAALIRRPVNGGAAAARNTGLAAVTTELVAFVDSDCVPGPDWIDGLAGHFADPAVAAVAPRIAGLAPETWAGRYTRAAGALDLGDRPARVIPGGRVSYLPTAALLARRRALVSVEVSSSWSAGGHEPPPPGWVGPSEAPGSDSFSSLSTGGVHEPPPPGWVGPSEARGSDDFSSLSTGEAFDPRLRVGEDVDLVWRLHARGWRIRYDPSVRVAHREPTTWRALLSRRLRYGTSAAPLALRHPYHVKHLILRPWPAVTVGALLARRPLLATGAFALATAEAGRAHRAAGLPAGSLPGAATATAQTWLGIGQYATRFAAPLLLACAARRGTRLAAASLLLGPPLAAWLRRRPAIDPLRYVLGALADDVAYGIGVWAGCLTHRTSIPLRPVLVGARQKRESRDEQPVVRIGGGGPPPGPQAPPPIRL